MLGCQYLEYMMSCGCNGYGYIYKFSLSCFWKVDMCCCFVCSIWCCYGFYNCWIDNEYFDILDKDWEWLLNFCFIKLVIKVNGFNKNYFWKKSNY